MYNELDFQKFFDKSRQAFLDDMEREIALSFITPNQVVHAKPTRSNPLCCYHLDLSLQIISDIYKIAKPPVTDRKLYYMELLVEINKYIKNDERNYVIARYILSKYHKAAILELPCYITTSEYQEIMNLKSVYEDLDISTSVIIHNYDPIESYFIGPQPTTFSEDNFNTGLDKAIKYIEENKSIITDYQLNAPKEYILK